MYDLSNIPRFFQPNFFIQKFIVMKDNILRGYTPPPNDSIEHFDHCLGNIVDNCLRWLEVDNFETTRLLFSYRYAPYDSKRNV